MDVANKRYVDGQKYTLPIAGPSQLGGVQPAAKTDAMTQAVGVDASGALFTAGTPVSDLKSTLTNIVTFLKAVPFDDTVVSASDLDDIQNKIDALGSSGGTEETVSAAFSDGVLAISGVTVNSATFTDGVLAVE